MNFNLENKLNIITGHYGCGKTTISTNFAINLAKLGEKVVIIDLDIVNPYFKTSDFKDIFNKYNIKCISPLYDNTNLDVPFYGEDIRSFLSLKDSYIIVDVGGDDAGATALGQFYDIISELNYSMFYVFNVYRYTTSSQSNLSLIFYDIQRKSRLNINGLINNSNIGPITTKDDIINSLYLSKKFSDSLNLDIKFNCISNSIGSNLNIEKTYLLEIYSKQIW